MAYHPLERPGQAGRRGGAGAGDHAHHLVAQHLVGQPRPALVTCAHEHAEQVVALALAPPPADLVVDEPVAGLLRAMVRRPQGHPARAPQRVPYGDLVGVGPAEQLPQRLAPGVPAGRIDAEGDVEDRVHERRVQPRPQRERRAGRAPVGDLLGELLRRGAQARGDTIPDGGGHDLAQPPVLLAVQPAQPLRADDRLLDAVGLR